MNITTTDTHADPLLDDLTEPQRDAVTHVDGPLLVLAAAGSGKTRVITRRIAHLVLRVGIAPWNVLAITFTNKAAGEMRERVAGLMSQRQADAVTVCTFHSLCARLVRRYAHYLELPSGYSIYDSADQTRAMKNTLKALEISTSNFPPGKVLSAISKAKNDLLNPEAFAASAMDFYSRTIAQIYKKYQHTLTQNKALDFDDLLLRTVELMKQHPDVLDELRRQYVYVLIDEYQDTNHAQFSIAHNLSAGHRNICATGDPDQSIYGWRGADIRNILEFETLYPNVTTVRLEQNYRSTKHILAAADRLIRHNTQRKHKDLWTENDQGDPVRVAACRDERREAQWVVDWFTRLHDRHDTPWSDMAVFYRVNSLSRVVEDAFRNANVPYQIARGTSFYERKEIKDAIAYLRAIANPADAINLLRIINTPSRGISPTAVKAMAAYAVAHSTHLPDVLQSPGQVEALGTRATASVTRFAERMSDWRATLSTDNETPLRAFVERVLRESGLERYYRNDKTDPDQERLMNLGELVSSAQQFELDNQPVDEDEYPSLAHRLEAYLEQISLVSDVDAIDTSQGAVTLMTLHAAKGLEFPAVAMVGVEDGLLPHSISQEDPHGLEEERRLCFVGITRAKERLTLLHTRYRTIFGQLQPSIPSRFIDEMAGDQLDREDFDAAAAGQADFVDEPALDCGYDDDPEALRPGTLVRHPQFGLGRVLELRPGGPQARARIEFNTVGTKTLILQYARLERVHIHED